MIKVSESISSKLKKSVIPVLIIFFYFFVFFTCDVEDKFIVEFLSFLLIPFVFILLKIWITFVKFDDKKIISFKLFSFHKIYFSEIKSISYETKRKFIKTTFYIPVWIIRTKKGKKIELALLDDVEDADKIFQNTIMQNLIEKIQKGFPDVEFFMTGKC